MIEFNSIQLFLIFVGITQVQGNFILDFMTNSPKKIRECFEPEELSNITVKSDTQMSNKFIAVCMIENDLTLENCFELDSPKKYLFLSNKSEVSLGIVGSSIGNTTFEKKNVTFCGFDSLNIGAFHGNLKIDFLSFKKIENLQFGPQSFTNLNGTTVSFLNTNITSPLNVTNIRQLVIRDSNLTALQIGSNVRFKNYDYIIKNVGLVCVRTASRSVECKNEVKLPSKNANRTSKALKPSTTSSIESNDFQVIIKQIPFYGFFGLLIACSLMIMVTICVCKSNTTLKKKNKILKNKQNDNENGILNEYEDVINVETQANTAAESTSVDLINQEILNDKLKMNIPEGSLALYKIENKIDTILTPDGEEPNFEFDNE
uniref:CSON000203 protein n=1 Tax=Culicoides sonorensis TaxID=179676 RepID=A0A336MRF5_CULSO